MRHSAIRQKIVETASNLFYHNGYNLTGINEIIDEAGIAKATLYNHFKSKEDICLAYLDYKNVTFNAEIKSFVAKAPEGKERVLALLGFLKGFFKDKDFNGCWCINTISEIPKENQRIRAEIQLQKRQFIEYIEELVSTNAPRSTEEENANLARQVYLLYESALAESHLHQDSWPIDSALRVFNGLLE